MNTLEKPFNQQGYSVDQSVVVNKTNKHISNTAKRI